MNIRMGYLLGLGWAAAGLAVGCDPLNNIERDYYRKQGAQAAPRSYRNPAATVKEETLATQMVQEAPAPDGQGTMTDWVQREKSALSGDVLFPQWKARRIGLRRYEVEFLFTLVDSTKVMRHRGYAWEVDVSLKLVSPPRELAERAIRESDRRP